MSLKVRPPFEIPAETVTCARAAFPKGNVYMHMRERLGVIYQDSDFADLFTTHQGRPAEAPGLLVLVLIMGYAEGLTDQQTAEAVRARIDWKYALGLPLTDPGVDASVLSELRDRIIAGGQEQQLLDHMLAQFQEQGYVKGQGKQRTDSTHVLAATRHMNRLEVVGETMRQALNTLAEVAPVWLRLHIVIPDWYERYGPRFEQYRLPRRKAEQKSLAELIGRDGAQLLQALTAPEAPPSLRQEVAVEMLRQVWLQQYQQQDGQVLWRSNQDLPPASLLIQSPYDSEARNRTKRDLNWTGYLVHLTETCDTDTPNLITHVETTVATTSDVEMTQTIQTALADKGLLPSAHYVDAGYTSTDHLIASQQLQVDLVGPVPPDPSWQARAGQGFDISGFVIDWEKRQVTCPAQHLSYQWRERQDTTRNIPVIQISFDPNDCTSCGFRTLCTTSQKGGRQLLLRPQPEHESLQSARQRQQTPEFREAYKTRAGIEGTHSQGIRSLGLRRARYMGLAKVHLQHILTAAAMNLTRVVAWLDEIPKAPTRVSRFARLAVSR
ncbi:MAG: IS1182 family transposase [Chloroflexi bacterium]|nr:IS1182 family transposase [Chloroflexota bacterium]